MRRGDHHSERDPMAWMAPSHCYRCAGLGMKSEQSESVFHPRMRLCDCVYRAIFRHCFNRYRYLRDYDLFLGRRANLVIRPGLGPSYEFKGIDFIADIESTAAKWLHDRELLVWRHHYLGNLIWRACLPLAHCNRGQFFSACYRLEQNLGKWWLESGMYPRDYFTAHYIPHFELPRPPEQRRYPIFKEEEAA